MIEVKPGITLKDSEFDISFSRSSGPGGQNVNKVNSKVTLKWFVGGSEIPEDVKRRFVEAYSNSINQRGEYVMQCDIHRDQARNLSEAKRRLVDMILKVWSAPKPRKSTKPSKGAIEARLTEKRIRAQQKQLRKKVEDSE